MISLQVECKMEQGKISFHFEFDEGEPKKSSSMMAKRQFYAQLPGKLSLQDIHPDHLALAAFLVVRPWLKKSIRFSWGVSKRFVESLVSQKFHAGPVDPTIAPYSSENGKYVGLAFSGGVDSTAALSVLPDTTIPVFLDRPYFENSLYKKEAAIQTCHKLIKLGYNCQMIECDLEFLRQPIGFPTDLSNAVPAILLAQHLSLFTISFGTVFESLYGLGRLIYKDYEKSSHKKSWWNVFEAAGIPISFPVGGVSEVGTELICSKSFIGNFAQSCIRGDISLPCFNCWKCFRKTTVRKSLKLEGENATVLSSLLSSKEVKMKLSKLPISHENVLLYAFSRLNFENYPLNFQKRFDFEDDLSYLEGHYSPAIDYVHPRIREQVESKVLSFLRKMSIDEEKNAQSWNNESRISTISALVFDS
tara:strand:+ start:1227 stop:2480 length:1254 start_codon:yes stop_codon:yes gene_type:complete